MIKVTQKDLENLKQKIPKNHLIIATASYSGWKNVLGFLAVSIANSVQWLTKPKYDNKRIYVGHCFTIFHKNESLWVGEMDFNGNWKENPIEKSNTFIKLTTGQIRIFDIGAIPTDIFQNFLLYSKTVKYPPIGAIASKKIFWFLKIFRSKKSFAQKRHCGEIFVRYKPFFKYLKTTGKILLKKYRTHHPEAIDYYLKNNFDLKIVKVKKGKILC